METVVDTFELRPSVKAVVQNDLLSQNLKQGTEVTLGRASLSGALAKIEGSNKYDVIAEFDAEAVEEIKKQAKEARKMAAMYCSEPVVRRRPNMQRVW
ncbi:MAG TPA: hypothetical protein VF974_00465 [Patescibacteria group bacterium]